MLVFFEIAENAVPLNAENCIPLSNYTLDPGHALLSHNSDNPNCRISDELLSGNNYAQWKRSCEICLSAKNRMSFLNGDFDKPAPILRFFPFGNVVIAW